MLIQVAGSRPRCAAPSGGGGGSEPTPNVFENFSTYSNIAQLQASSLWDEVEQSDVSLCSINTSVGYGSSDRCLQYTFPEGADGGYEPRPGIMRFTGQTEVCIETVAAFSTNFEVDAGFGSGNEYKFITCGDIGGTGRFNIPEMQPGNWVCGYPDAVAFANSQTVTPSSLWDGLPHVYRAQTKISTGGNGALRFWVDSALQHAVTGFTHTTGGHSAVNYVSLGRNLNEGPVGAAIGMWVRWFQVSIWYPGNFPSWRVA